MSSSISGFQNDKQECHTDYKYPDFGYLSVCMAFIIVYILIYLLCIIFNLTGFYIWLNKVCICIIPQFL